MNHSTPPFCNSPYKTTIAPRTSRFLAKLLVCFGAMVVWMLYFAATPNVGSPEIQRHSTTDIMLAAETTTTTQMFETSTTTPVGSTVVNTTDQSSASISTSTSIYHTTTVTPTTVTAEKTTATTTTTTIATPTSTVIRPTTAITTTIATTTTTTPAPTTTTIAVPNDEYGPLAQEILYYVNLYRAEYGVAPLSFGNSQMQLAPEIRAQEIVESFSHTRPDGRRFLTVFYDIGICNYIRVGENLLYGRAEIGAEEMVREWMASSSHRENILNDKYTYINIAYRYSGDAIYVVQHFYQLP